MYTYVKLTKSIYMKQNIDLKIISPLIGSNDGQIPLPNYATDMSAGLDLRACIEQDLIILPNETKLINTGIAIFINDPKIAMTLLPRSGLGHKHGIVLGNLIGLIDSDYQNEIFISCWNRGNTEYTIKPGERICQAVFIPIIQIEFKLVTEFTETTARGLGGFGHTGKH